MKDAFRACPRPPGISRQLFASTNTAQMAHVIGHDRGVHGKGLCGQNHITVEGLGVRPSGVRAGVLRPRAQRLAA